ncbi:MAG: hypothetical protein Q7S57_00315 [bacterium]|nr:hypothetical protein [bacterium]
MNELQPQVTEKRGLKFHLLAGFIGFIVIIAIVAVPFISSFIIF